MYHTNKVLTSNLENGYLSLWAKIEKSKGILLSFTLKVKENELPLDFSNFCSGADTNPEIMRSVSDNLNNFTKIFLFREFHHNFQLCWDTWLYLGLWTQIEKRNKFYLFSQTLNVEENKGALVFSYFAQGLRWFSHFLSTTSPRCHPWY